MAVLIPYAFDEKQNIVHIEDTTKCNKYFCIECCGLLIQRQGKIKAHHFAHAVKTKNCSEESLIHKIAKRLVCKAVNEQVTIKMTKMCSLCKTKIDYSIDTKSRFSFVKEEERHGVFVIDVMIFSKEEKPCLAVEILHTHAVTEDKIQNIGMPWIELKAADVIDNPSRWIIVRGSKAVTCEKCIDNKKEAILKCTNYIKKIAYLLKKYNLNNINWTIFRERKADVYQVSILECYHCHSEIPVFNTGQMWSMTKPPEPIPRTLQCTYSKTINKEYWMNTCPKCRAKQGDTYLYFLAINNSEDINAMVHEFQRYGE